MKIVLPLLLFCCLLTACSPSSQKQTRFEINGTQQERIARATNILSKYCQLPGLLFDAHMAEDIADNSGGLVPGPSDSWLSGVLIIQTNDIAKWREALSPLRTVETSHKFTSPIKPPGWWPVSSSFIGCEFYEPKKLTGRSGGFVALSPTNCAIYFSTF